jgi:hypothetical protein
MPVAYPLPLPAGMRLSALTGPYLETIAAVTRSPFTGAQQVQEWSSAWQIALELRALRVSDVAVLAAWIASMRGRVGTALVGPMIHARPRGTANTAGVATGTAAARARALPVTGLGAGKTLLAGDFLQLGSGAGARLHQLVATATADGAGAATLDIEPPLRAPVTPGNAVTLMAPKGVFRLTSNAPPVPRTGSAGAVASLSFEEVL